MFQAGFRVVRKVFNPVFVAAREAAVAPVMSSHNASSTSWVRYSAPAIIGAVNMSEASSVSVGAATSGSARVSSNSESDACRQSEPI